MKPIRPRMPLRGRPNLKKMFGAQKPAAAKINMGMARKPRPRGVKD